LGYAPRFWAFFWLWAFLRFDGESTLPPQAGNADRWAAQLLMIDRLRGQQ
jgi:hypothetical protein